MGAYHFVSTWQLEVPIETVWQTVVAGEEWPIWWKSVRHATRLTPGDALGVGSKINLAFSTKLPYRLEVELTVARVEPPSRLEVTAAGELVGRGLWELAQSGTITTIRYTWQVRTTKAWMNLAEPLMRPFFSWNHNAVMTDCANAMAAHLGTTLVGPATHVTL